MSWAITLAIAFDPGGGVGDRTIVRRPGLVLSSGNAGSQGDGRVLVVVHTPRRVRRRGRSHERRGGDGAGEAQRS